MTRAPLLLLMAFALLLAACQADGGGDEDPDGGPHLWAYFEVDHGADRPAFRTAVLLSQEGWSGAESLGPVVALFSDLHADGQLRIVVDLAGATYTGDCPARGCFLYVRTEDGPWQALHARPIGDPGRLYLSLPWTLQSILEANDRLEIDVPVTGLGRCTYTFYAGGYRHDLHTPAGPVRLDWKGEPFPESPDIPVDLDGPPPDDREWPRCTGRPDTNRHSLIASSP
ncbi:hypothetical protein [Silanimonas lenta]|uniref:hypothetical protein n=1 Tax=Silanimonas lenta TaxID=265429 RepID=UPI002FE23E50